MAQVAIMMGYRWVGTLVREGTGSMTLFMVIVSLKHIEYRVQGLGFRAIVPLSR